MASGASLKGAAEMKRRIQMLQRKFPDEVVRALRVEAEVEATEVKRRTPVDRGNLRASVHVVGPTRIGNRIVVYIAAGGPAASYALYVHEDLQAFHKVGQAKYIESVILESRPFMAQRVARRISLYRAIAAS